MSKLMPPTPLRQEDYLAIEAAVMETARGRWFLSEYARRNRNADTDTLLNAIDKLEKSIIRDSSPASLMDRVKMDLADMAKAIEKTKREIAQIKHEDNQGAQRFDRASVELDAIVTQTESATGEILGAAEKIQEIAWTLREAGADEDKCNDVDMEATNIYMACSFQDLTGQRIKKIVDVMRYIETRINSMTDIWGFETDAVDIDHTEAKAHDVRPDAHLLNGPQLEGEGVDQGDVDTLFDNAVEEDSNQDDVDALFDNAGADLDSIDFDSVDFDSDIMDEADEADFEAQNEAEGAEDADESVAEAEIAEAEEEAETALMDDVIDVAAGEDDVAYIDTADLDWAGEDDAAEAVDDAELASEDMLDASEDELVSEQAEADVFATAEMADEAEVDDFDALTDEEKAAVELFDEPSADVFESASSEDEADAELDDALEMGADADVFASAEADEGFDEISEDIDEEPADLRDRVAEFS